MTRLTSPLTGVAALLALGLTALAANAAGPSRTFVSATGTDSGTCTRATPCRTLAFAHGVTASGGEIAILDTAGYGSLTITKSISIVNPGGVEAGILASAGGDALTIAAAGSDVISLRGLTIEGAGSGANGIVLTTGGKLTIVDSVVRGFTANGINIAPSSGATTFFIGNTLVSDNGSIGIRIAPPLGIATASGSMNHVAANNNGANGIHVSGALTFGAAMKVTITNSVATGNTSVGILCESADTYAATRVVVTNSSVSGNGYGVYTGGSTSTAPAFLWISSSVASSNANYGLYNAIGSSGHMFTFGNNVVVGNTSGPSFGPIDSQGAL
ncbi:MAG: hypothetical protein QOI12_891 [Alphaproteobacteria bacterium]|jgi:hypothetical protein|nr:hypothetical protein [Alphaproteobacteria bacterium]